MFVDTCCKFHVNPKLIRLKAHFFFVFGGLSGILVPLILYCQQLGMSVSMVGILFAVLPFVQFVAKLVVGSIADKLQMHKMVFVVSLVLMTLSFFSINLMPKLSPVTNHDTLHEGNTTFQCLGQSSMSASSDSPPDLSEMQLKMCDHSQKNSTQSVLAASSGSCSLSCGEAQLPSISSLFCEEDHLQCLSKDVYSLHETLGKELKINLTASIISQVWTNESALSETSASNVHCSTLTVKTLSLVDTVPVMSHLKSTAVTSCPANTNITFTCSAICRADDYMVPPGDRDTGFQIVWIWVACFIGFCSYGTMVCVSDTILLSVLGEKMKDFGKTRLFASVGWGAMSAVGGYAIDLVSVGLPEKNYSPGFYIFLGFMIMDIVVSIPIQVNIIEKSEKLVMEVVSLFKSRDVFIFATAVYLIGVNTGFMWTFVVVYANELNGEQVIIGLNYAVECFLSEIPVFMASGYIVQWLGYSNSLSFVVFICGLKALLYSLIYNAWYMLLIALLHGPTYALLYATMSRYAGVIAPPGTSATLQGLFQGLFEGVGVGTGSLIGGQLYENLGGRAAFQIFGLVTIALSTLHFLSNWISVVLAKRTGISDCTTAVPPVDAKENSVGFTTQMKEATVGSALPIRLYKDSKVV